MQGSWMLQRRLKSLSGGKWSNSVVPNYFPPKSPRARSVAGREAGSLRGAGTALRRHHTRATVDNECNKKACAWRTCRYGHV
jgi:hypothetical protein